VKVLLLKPCWPYPISRKESTYNRMWPPLSLAYSAALLEQAGMEVKIFDAHAQRVSGRRLASHLRGFDKIFITSSDLDRWLCPNLDLTPVLEAAVLARGFTQELYLMGQHGTVQPEQLLAFTGARAVIRGEPEQTVLDLCRADQLDQVSGITFQTERGICSTPGRPLASLETLPIPAFHQLPLAKYHYELLGQHFMLLETSRGCPFHCTFCAKDVMYGHGFRRKSLGRVLEEVDLAVKRHGVRTIYFYDLEFLIHRPFIYQLCEALRQRHYPLRWCCQSRVTDVDEPLLSRLRQAGCTLIHYGVESGSQRLLDASRKEITLDEAQRAVRLTRQHGIQSLCFFMVGLPNETPEETTATLEFAQKLKPTYVSFHLAAPHEELRPVPDGNGHLLAFPIQHPSFNPLLKRSIRRSFWRFYLRPGYVWGWLCSTPLKLLLHQVQFFLRYTLPLPWA